MNLYIEPQKEQWKDICKRPAFDFQNLSTNVSAILADISNRGDKALIEYEEKFDNVRLNNIKVSESEIEEAEQLIDSKLKKAIDVAYENIYAFHSSQLNGINKVETMPGVVCWQKSIAIDKVGLYVPGGNAPLFSTVLMLAIPAKIAGCSQILVCTPPGTDGKISPSILYAAKVAGATDIFKLGGVQAIGAMTYGTDTVPATYKIFGPGNQYVTMAKQIVSQRDVAIDMPAGPSEVLVIADEYSNPDFVATDFLSQAEHGADSQSVLVTTELAFVEKFKFALEKQLNKLPRKDLAESSLNNSKIVVLKDKNTLLDFTNEYAPEHLIIQTEDYINLAQKVRNAGSVFLGPFTPESAGDYASGTNHTLPTNGYAKSFNGVNLDSFMKKVTFQEISKSGLISLAETIEVMAENESLIAHKNAVSVRIENIN